MKEALDEAVGQFRPDQIALIAPVIPKLQYSCNKDVSDSYYRLDLANLHMNQKSRNMIKHSSRELSCEKRQGLGDEHKQLISEFLNTHKVDEDTQRLLKGSLNIYPLFPQQLFLRQETKMEGSLPLTLQNLAQRNMPFICLTLDQGSAMQQGHPIFFCTN